MIVNSRVLNSLWWSKEGVAGFNIVGGGGCHGLPCPPVPRPIPHDPLTMDAPLHLHYTRMFLTIIARKQLHSTTLLKEIYGTSLIVSWQGGAGGGWVEISEWHYPPVPWRKLEILFHILIRLIIKQWRIHRSGWSGFHRTTFGHEGYRQVPWSFTIYLSLFALIKFCDAILLSRNVLVTYTSTTW